MMSRSRAEQLKATNEGSREAVLSNGDFEVHKWVAVDNVLGKTADKVSGRDDLSISSC